VRYILPEEPAEGEMVILPKETPVEQKELIPAVQIDIRTDTNNLPTGMFHWHTIPGDMVEWVKKGQSPKHHVLKLLQFRLDVYRQFLESDKDILNLCSNGKITRAETQENIGAVEKAIEELTTMLNSPPETAVDVQASAQGTAAASKADPVKATMRWLKNEDRQYIRKHTKQETPVMLNGVLERIEPSVSEWRIIKPVAYIYRELCSASERGEISLTKDAISDFMFNNLKLRDGKDITKDSLVKAKERTNSDKSRQTPTK
jgi:hypothetical protein